MKAIKFLAGAAGTAAIGIGVLLLAVSIGVAAWIGRDDTVELPRIHAETDHGTVIVDDIEILADSARFAVTDELGRARITVRSQSGEDVFVGVTEAHMARALPDDPTRWGEATWLVSDYGETATVDFDVSSGNWSLVMTDTDSRALDVTVDTEITAAPFRLAAGIVGTIGAGIALIGGMLLWLGVRRQPVGPAPVAAAV